jgi:hypothetical protein
MVIWEVEKYLGIVLEKHGEDAHTKEIEYCNSREEQFLERLKLLIK